MKKVKYVDKQTIITASNLNDMQDAITENETNIAQLSSDLSNTSNSVENLTCYVTPEMFGAVGDGETDDSDAFTRMLANNSKIRIGSGKYKISEVLIDHDVDLDISKDATIIAGSGIAFTAVDCSVRINGGIFLSGQKYTNRYLTNRTSDSRTAITSGSRGIIEFYGCSNCVIENIKVPYSSSTSVILLYGDSTGDSLGGSTNNDIRTISGHECGTKPCRNIIVRNSYFEDTLMTVVHVVYHCENITIDSCSSFKSLKTNTADYAYGLICTGVRDIVAQADLGYTPPDGIIVRDCYVEDCEGTAIDTHAACNVLYENNKIVNSDSFLTAYNDAGRVRMADGWVMRNIIIRNNICVNNKTFPWETESYPHNPVMIHNNGVVGAMENVIFENNYIDTGFYHAGSQLPWEMVSCYSVNNLTMRNNTFKSTATEAIAAYPRYGKSVIENNKLIGTFRHAFYFKVEISTVKNNDFTDATINTSVLGLPSNYYSRIDVDGSIVHKGSGTDVSNWDFNMNVFDKPLESNTGIGRISSDVSEYTYYSGKYTSEGYRHLSVDGATIETGVHFAPVGSLLRIGTSYSATVINAETHADGHAFYTMSVEPTSDNLSSSVYLVVRCPYQKSYTKP